MGVKDISFLKKVYALELRSALEYRFNFFAQTLGMILNDMFWILFWFLLFRKFGSIGGWGFKELVLMFSLAAFSVGMTEFLFGNARKIAKLIEEGTLDYYLTLPKNVLLHLIAKVNYPGLGDLIVSIILAFFVLSFRQIPLFILFGVMGVLIFLGWYILMGSITFFKGRFQEGASVSQQAFVHFISNPFSVYEGFTRFLLLFVIPAGFITGVPVELLAKFSWKWFFIAVAFSIFFFSFAVIIFYVGLKRYESGNSLAMRG